MRTHKEKKTLNNFSFSMYKKNNSEIPINISILVLLHCIRFCIVFFAYNIILHLKDINHKLCKFIILQLI